VKTQQSIEVKDTPMKTRSLLAALFTLALTSTALADDYLPSDWKKARARFSEGDSTMYLTVERDTRLATVETYRPGAEAGSVKYITHGPFELSAELLKRFTTQLAFSRKLEWTPLRSGDKGKEVYDLQQRLLSLGYRVPTDGRMNPGTAEALRRYQALSRIPTTGIYDGATRRSMHPRRLIVGGTETADERSLGDAKVIAISTILRAEPEVKALEGKLAYSEGALRLETESGSYEVEGLQPYLQTGLQTLGRARVQAQVWEQGGIAVVTAIQVRATREAKPEGVAVGELVIVTGASGNPAHPRLSVRDDQGNVGVLKSPTSAHGPRGRRSGAADLIRGLGGAR
jgi:peptidoglycan hydrolase-like protein with peptidoglycan-binding domain